MPTTIINLKAGKPTRQLFDSAKYLLLQDLGVAASVDVDIEVNGYAKESIAGLRAGEQIQTPGFTAASFTANVDCQIQVLASFADVRVNNISGATVSANIIGTVPVNVTGPDPLPVHADRGDNAGNPLYVSGQVLGDTPAAHITDNAGVAASQVAANLLAADATRLEAVIFNQGPDPVAIGMVGITWAKRAIVLNAGDAWIESRAAAQAWQVITDAGKGATVTVQERKA